MPLRTLILLTPSLTASLELPRRLASTGQALAGLLPLTPFDLARRLAEPALLGRGLLPWNRGHAVCLAEALLEGPDGFHLPEDQPRAPVALGLARTFEALRGAEIEARALVELAPRLAAADEDVRRLGTLATLYARYRERTEGRFADTATILRAATDALGTATWLRETSVLIVEDLTLDASTAAFLVALARVVPTRRLARALPPRLSAQAFGPWCATVGIADVTLGDSPLAALATTPETPTAGLAALRGGLFEPPSGRAARDESVALLTAPGEAAEARAVVRQLLREAARGVPFEEMAVAFPRAELYAPLFTDLLSRLGIPFRVHPSLPLRTGRTARSLLLLFACRGLPRAAVMELLTFAPIPFEELLGEGAAPEPALWDLISREAGVVSGLARWLVGLRLYGNEERSAAQNAASASEAVRHETRAEHSETLLRVVELLGAALDALAGEASWPEWSERLLVIVEQWIGCGSDEQESREAEALRKVVEDLAGLAAFGARVAWTQVERVLAGRLEWERVPLEPLETGAVHLGAFDVLAGIPFRVLAIPGLVEGGYPGPIRQDPFLLDPERAALVAAARPPATRRALSPRQLSLFDEPASPPPAPEAALPSLPTTFERLLVERRAFHQAVCQATERLILSYPRADPRSGRERLPSLFFVAAASAREGRTLTGAELDERLHEDALRDLQLDDALDRSERDRARLLRDEPAAATAIAAGTPFFARARLANRARWSRRTSAFDGLVSPLPDDLRRGLDPTVTTRAVSASRLATYARCGFLYFLRYVLHLDPVAEPQERQRLDPLERGTLFHDVAEAFLRERRERGELPLRDTRAARLRLRAIAEEALDRLVAASPPRFVALWQRERERFHEHLACWFEREVAQAGRATPLHFEVAFGLPPRHPEEAHLEGPLEVTLGEGRVLRLEGRIDRVDQRPDGTLVLRDYKTGRAPRDDGQVFRPGVQLQIPIYLLALRRLFPERTVSEAFLDYVDGGRMVGVDPTTAGGERLERLLAGLVDAIAAGLFVQEPAACATCDFVAVCGPQPLLARRRVYKLEDPVVRRYLRLKERP